MKKVVVILMLSLGFSIVVSADGDTAAGQAKIAMCSSCHGVDGNSVIPTFPKLAGQNAKYLLKQMQDVLSGKRVVVEMTGLLNAFSDDDLADIAAYYASQQSTLGVADPDLVELGQKLYRAGNADKVVPACTACHSPTGAGNSQAGFPALSGQHSAYISKQLDAYRNELRANDPARIMRDIAARLSDQEIAALASYIQGLSN
jgi:cytochrome c553